MKPSGDWKPTADRQKGLRGTNQDIYDTLVLGTTITKTIQVDSKSWSFRYVDWERPANNTYHVTAELSVERTASTQTRRCNIVAYVNGIPFIVIENKRPTESLKKADSQLIGYQNEDNIPQLFHFAQFLMVMNRVEARYATVGTPQQFSYGTCSSRSRTRRTWSIFVQFLADEAIRQEFYERLKAFSRCLHISLSSDKLFDVFDEAKIDAIKRDWKQFSELRRSIQLRYQETVDVKEFEPKIQKLLDDHMVAVTAKTIIEMVNINDPDALKAVVEETGQGCVETQ